MKSSFIALLALPAFLSPNSYAEVADLSEPADIVQYVVREADQFNFEPRARYAHPESLAVYRSIAMQIIGKCLDRYDEEVVKIALDLPEGLSALTKYDDRGFYVHLSNCLSIVLPDSDPGESEVVAVVEREHEIEVVYSRQASLETVEAPRRLTVHSTMVFRRSKGRWMIAEMPLRFTEHSMNVLCDFIKGASESSDPAL